MGLGHQPNFFRVLTVKIWPRLIHRVKSYLISAHRPTDTHCIPIDNANNLVFWCRFLNKLEPWHTVYIMQQ